MRNSTRRALAVAVPAMILAGCQDGGTTTPPTGTEPTSARQWVMPNLVGSTLQQAQDRIQQVTGNPLFLTVSHDATGQKRTQVVDSNWKVCSQNIPAGNPFTKDTTIDFAAVKVTEDCPAG